MADSVVPISALVASVFPHSPVVNTSAVAMKGRAAMAVVVTVDIGKIKAASEGGIRVTVRIDGYAIWIVAVARTVRPVVVSRPYTAEQSCRRKQYQKSQQVFFHRPYLWFHSTSGEQLVSNRPPGGGSIGFPFLIVHCHAVKPPAGSLVPPARLALEIYLESSAAGFQLEPVPAKV